MVFFVVLVSGICTQILDKAYDYLDCNCLLGILSERVRI